MVQDKQAGMMEAVHVPDGGPAVFRMFPNPVEFFVGKLAGFQKDVIRYTDFANVVQGSGEDDLLGLFVGKSHLNGYPACIGGNAFAVSARVSVSQVDQRDEGARHRERLLHGAVFELRDPKSVVDRNDTVHCCHSLAQLGISRVFERLF